MTPTPAQTARRTSNAAKKAAATKTAAKKTAAKKAVLAKKTAVAKRTAVKKSAAVSTPVVQWRSQTPRSRFDHGLGAAVAAAAAVVSLWLGVIQPTTVAWVLGTGGALVLLFVALVQMMRRVEVLYWSARGLRLVRWGRLVGGVDLDDLWLVVARPATRSAAFVDRGLTFYKDSRYALFVPWGLLSPEWAQWLVQTRPDVVAKCDASALERVTRLEAEQRVPPRS